MEYYHNTIKFSVRSIHVNSRHSDLFPYYLELFLYMQIYYKINDTASRKLNYSCPLLISNIPSADKFMQDVDIQSRIYGNLSDLMKDTPILPDVLTLNVFMYKYNDEVKINDVLYPMYSARR